MRFICEMSLFLSLCLLPLVLTGQAAEADSPETFLWAWQRSEDLSSIDPKEFGVAYLACHVVLTGQFVRQHWRDQPLKVPASAVLVPVVRIDSDRKKVPALDDKQIDVLVDVVRRLANLPQTMQVQIDFDALESERPFYRKLLARIHTRLPDTPLSITALTSWCIFDDWIRDLPVAEAVPMLFSLGRERQKILLYFRAGRDFRVPACSKSLGLSLEETEVNEIMVGQARQRKNPVRFYIFTKTAWNEDKIQAVRLMLSKS